MVTNQLDVSAVIARMEGLALSRLLFHSSVFDWLPAFHLLADADS